MYTVEEAIANLKEEIAEKQEQIIQLQQFSEIAERGLTEQEYHNFCDTDLRYSDVLGKALLTVFPFLEYEKREANWFFYHIGDVQVCVPNSRCMGIDIVMPNLIPDLDKRIHSTGQKFWFRTKSLEKKIQLYQEYLQVKGIANRAKLMFPTYRTWFAVLRFIALGKQTADKEMRKKLEEALEEQKVLEEKIRQKNTEVANVYDSQKIFFNKYIPMLLEWTDTVRVQTALDGCVAMKFTKENGEIKC